MGAASVLGIDIDPAAISGCQLLTKLYGFADMEFFAADFTTLSPDEEFDCILLINFIGWSSLCKGIGPILDIVRSVSRGDIILSARPVYTLSGSLEAASRQLCELYGCRYVRDGACFLAEFLADFFSGCWRGRIISPDHADQTIKRTFLFQLRG